MTDDPYPNTPAHTVLLHMAYGDHQVANIGTEVEARTIGATLRPPGARPGPQHRRGARSTAIEPIRRYPYRGSALVVWDIGPLRPPAAASGSAGCDGTASPDHEHGAAPRPRPARDHRPRAHRAALQFSRFIDGELIDVCGDAPCHAAGWTGP